ncbi:MAG: porin family protein [Porphyromonadaceae bacterium]|nr:porin family protein [Porphyromonadaceae bacterium]
MRSLYILFLWLLPLFAGAQVITYDTISVSPDDPRNIHRANKSRNFAEKETSSGIRRGEIEKGITPLFDRSKLRFGANLGLSVSSNYTRLGLGPQVGYQFNRYFMAGAGINYYYSKARTSGYTVKDNLLGANLFSYFYPLSFITVFVQPETNYIWSALTSETTDETISHRGLVPSLIVGAGFRLGRSHITLNYDLIQDDYSPHPDGVYLGVSAFF